MDEWVNYLANYMAGPGELVSCLNCWKPMQRDKTVMLEHTAGCEALPVPAITEWALDYEMAEDKAYAQRGPLRGDDAEAVMCEGCGAPMYAPCRQGCLSLAEE